MQQDCSEESWLEEQCHREINAQHEEYESEYVRHRDSTLSNVWGAFQDSATAVAHLYRERSSNNYPDTGALWLPFQTAAGTVTTLYKEACDGVKRTSDSAVQCGYQRRTRELADWAKSKKRRMIRREDLLAYLAGKPLTNNNRRSPKPEHVHTHSNANAVFNTNASHLTPPHMHSSHHHHNHAQQHHQASGGGGGGAATNESTNDLHTFKEALVLRPRGPELFAFVANEIARHCKRPASPIDDKMDICHYSSKRQRFM
ncbi:HUWE1-associated protein modifying stress responses [Eurosta solidaginis]|uniref:HUWE1-associated protein modifying stress responses n=1 Tax=Eurosta solidaginis TaxID=178769 RepID=UPI0035313EA1